MSNRATRDLEARWRRRQQEKNRGDLKPSNLRISDSARRVLTGDPVQLSHQEPPTQRIDDLIFELQQEFGPKQPRNELRKLPRPRLPETFITTGSNEWGSDYEHRGILSAFQNNYNRIRQEALDFFEANPGLVDKKTHKILKQKIEDAQNAYDNARTFEELLNGIKYLFTLKGISENSKLILQDFQAVAEYLYNLRYLDRVSFANAIKTLIVIGIMLPFMASSVVACTNTVGTTPVDSGVQTTIVVDQEESFEEPIGTDSEEDISNQEVEGEIEEEAVPPLTDEETVEAPPVTEEVGTRIPNDQIAAAAETANVTLTPEALAEFVELATPEGKPRAMYRMTQDGIIQLVLNSPETGRVLFFQLPAESVTSDENGIYFEENDSIVGTIGYENPTLTVTPEADAAPEPPADETEEAPVEEEAPIEGEVSVDPAEDIELVSQIAGVEVAKVNTFSHEEYAYASGDLYETKSAGDAKTSREYTLAYDAFGNVVARYTNVNGELQWIKGGPFEDEELENPFSIDQGGLAHEFGKVERVILTDFNWKNLRIFALSRVWIRTNEGQVAKWVISSAVWQETADIFHWQRGAGVFHDLEGTPESSYLTPDLIPGELNRFFRNIRELDYEPTYGFGDVLLLQYRMADDSGFDRYDPEQWLDASPFFYYSGAIAEWSGQQDYWNGNKDSHITVTPPTTANYWSSDTEGNYTPLILPDRTKIELIMPIISRWLTDY